MFLSVTSAHMILHLSMLLETSYNIISVNTQESAMKYIFYSILYLILSERLIFPSLYLIIVYNYKIITVPKSSLNY